MRVVFFASLLALAGCKHNNVAGNHNGFDACAQAGVSSLCGTACTSDMNCGTTLFCGTTGKCTADCVGLNGCATGDVCGPNGLCVTPNMNMMDGGSDDAPLCPSVQVNAAPVIPTLVLLLDQSGTMGDPFPTVNMPNTRWQGMKEALTYPNGVVTRYQSKVIFGASLYTRGAAAPAPKPPCPRLINTMSIKIGNKTEVENLLTMNNPADGTPTGESIHKLVDQLKMNPAINPVTSPTAILLVTDGLPDTCADGTDGTVTSKGLVVTEAKAAHDAGFPVYVLSLGDDLNNMTAKMHLDEVARNGLNDPTATAYSALDPTQFDTALNAIIRGVRVCTFTLNGTVDLAAAASGSVVLNSNPLIYGSDWQLSPDGKSMELLGAACTAFKDADTAALSASFPCGTVIF